MLNLCIYCKCVETSELDSWGPSLRWPAASAYCTVHTFQSQPLHLEVNMLSFAPATLTCCLVSIFLPEAPLPCIWHYITFYLQMLLFKPEAQLCAFTFCWEGLNGCQMCCQSGSNNILKRWQITYFQSNLLKENRKGAETQWYRTIKAWQGTVTWKFTNFAVTDGKWNHPDASSNITESYENLDSIYSKFFRVGYKPRLFHIRSTLHFPETCSLA